MWTSGTIKDDFFLMNSLSISVAVEFVRFFNLKEAVSDCLSGFSLFITATENFCWLWAKIFLLVFLAFKASFRLLILLLFLKVLISLGLRANVLILLFPEWPTDSFELEMLLLLLRWLLSRCAKVCLSLSTSILSIICLLTLFLLIKVLTNDFQDSLTLFLSEGTSSPDLKELWSEERRRSIGRVLSELLVTERNPCDLSILTSGLLSTFSSNFSFMLFLFLLSFF